MNNVNYSILIVDDQYGLRRLLYELFSDEGYCVRLAAGGLEALKLVSQEMPDIVLLDVKMPLMSGLETLSELKKINPELIVLMMTAYCDLDVVEQAKKIGVKHYIVKPFDVNELRLLVRGLLVDAGHIKNRLQEIG